MLPSQSDHRGTSLALTGLEHFYPTLQGLAVHTPFSAIHPQRVSRPHAGSCLAESGRRRDCLRQPARKLYFSSA